MSVGLLGRKVGMTQVYGEDGVILPVTVIEAGPCTVLQVRSTDKDGYSAVQVGFDDKLSDADKERSPDRRNRHRASKAERGHVKKLQSKRQKTRDGAGVAVVPKAECEPKRFIREFRMEGNADTGCEVGQELTVSLFDGIERVDVIGTNKGRGSAGVMKRHNFAGQPASHGAKKVHRRGGAIGAHATNRGTSGRISKGKRMNGRYGNARITVRNLKLVKVDPENHLLLVCGAIPGPNGGYVMIRKTNKLG
jgi:large subunit ribosomal protein L3